MDKTTFQQWLDAYGRAWETRDPEAVTALFTPDALYRWTPFGEPKRGREGIARAWKEATSRQGQIQFRYEILTVTGNRGIARWWCSLVRNPSKGKVQLDGIFLVTMATDKLCELFREWWHSDENRGT